MHLRNLLFVSAILFVCLPVGALADKAVSRTVSVSGTGEVVAQPDLAYVTFGVEARKPGMEEARADVAQTIDRVLDLTRELGIEPALVNATRVQIQPDYSWNDAERQRVLVGYLVSRQVQIELRDLEQLGTLLERAVDAGVNQVSDPVLDSSQRKVLERDAMAKAVEDARFNAETLANAAGAKLGAVRSLSDANAEPEPVFRRTLMMADAMSVSPADTYQAGEMKFSARVNAQFDLKIKDDD